MSFGKIYSYPNNPRVARAQIAARYVGVTIETPTFAMGKENRTPEYLAKFPTGKVPAFENDKTTIFESNAIAYYIASQGDGTLLGRSKEEAAQVIQWMLFSTNQLEGPITNWVYPLLGVAKYDEAAHTKAVQDTEAAIVILNKVLEQRTFLVGENITLADIIFGTCFVIPVKMVLAPKYLAKAKNLVRYLKTLFVQPQFVEVLGEVSFCETETKYTEPKKAEPKKELPPSSFNLEEWKRFYSNNTTRPTAIDWFWDHFDPEGCSIWRVDYKYNDELTLVFMSSNLIGGFFARLERARKHAFGSLCVTGTDGANEIGGYFVVRGQEIPEEVTDAADFDSYTFVKVDNLADKEFRDDFADYLAWDSDIRGKPWAAGKVFK